MLSMDKSVNALERCVCGNMERSVNVPVNERCVEIYKSL